MSGDKKGKKRPRRGSPRVAAWVHSVLNPWIVAVEAELRMLGDGSISFRHWSQDLEFLKPLQDYLPNNQWPTMEDLLDDDPSLGGFTGAHDDGREALKQAGRNAFNALALMPSLDSQLKSVFPPDNDFMGVIVVGPAQRADIKKSILESIVNNRKQIAPHHWDAQFYNPHAEQLLALRRGPEFDALAAAVEGMKAACCDCVMAFRDKRSELIVEFDIPASPQPGGAPRE